MLKISLLLISYYTRKLSIGQDCNTKVISKMNCSCYFSKYSGAHKRSDAYSNLLSKPQLLSMTWQTFKTLQPPWQSGSKQILIGGFQKCKTCPCASRGCKVTGCQILVLEKIKSVHRWRCFHMTIWYIKKMWFLKNEKSLTACNFAAPWGIWIILPFWKPPISYCLEPGVHGNSWAIMAQNPHSKMAD